MTQNCLLARARGGLPRTARREWCPPGERQTSTTALCAMTTLQAITTAFGHVKGVKRSSRGASKVRHKTCMNRY